MKIAIINGPNLNLLGKREPHIYGNTGFSDYLKVLQQRFPLLEISYYQSNAEGLLIDHIQTVGFEVDGIILNAGAYSHTSYAIADAISAIPAPVLEVHISNTFSREAFRHTDVLASRCVGLIAGLGLAGYDAALQWFSNKLNT
jgi:3-dehydroquinate dehydratase-2